MLAYGLGGRYERSRKAPKDRRPSLWTVSKQNYTQVNSKIGILAKMDQALAGAEAAPIEAIGAMQEDEKAGMTVLTGGVKR